MAWYLQSETTSYDTEFNTSIKDSLSGEDIQFQHTVIDTLGSIVSPTAYERITEPIWKWIVANNDIEFGQFRRIKINLLTRKETKHLYHTPHVDFDQPHWTILYYVNDSDGATYFLRTSMMVHHRS
ncbi:MAG: hypothetical protein CM15mV13_1540 [uncultured marine virus]|nr:MAG: hypothetical protein CM15mV13_1540 [uncultured marine virus]